MKTKILFILLLFLCFQIQILLAQQIADSTKRTSYSLTKVEKDLRDNSIWYFDFGYFPEGKNLSSGLSYLLGSEHQVSRYLNFGWRIQFVSVFENKQNFSGYLSLFMTFDNDFKLASRLFFIRGGLGLVLISTGLSTGAFLEIEYVVYQFSGFAISVSISQTFFRFKYLGPTIISIGIIF